LIDVLAPAHFEKLNKKKRHNMERTRADEEKSIQNAPAIETPSSELSSPSPKNAFERLNTRLAQFEFFESRGIERVPLGERKPKVTSADYMQMAVMWFSVNITANNMAVGMLGPSSYGLGFVDSALCATFGALLGAAGVAYMGTFGPVSGNRTMVCHPGDCASIDQHYGWTDIIRL
jgi:hypothetical protein